MSYSRFPVLMAQRTRGVALLTAVAFVGFSSVQLPAITKTASGDKTAAKGIHQGQSETEGRCIEIKTRSACVAHPRCQWAAGYCRKIYRWI